MTCILRCNVLVYQRPGLSGFTFFDGDNIFWTLQTSRELSLHIVETCVVISFCHCKSWIYIILIMDRYHFTCKWHQWRIMFQHHPPPFPHFTSSIQWMLMRVKAHTPPWIHSSKVMSITRHSSVIEASSFHSPPRKLTCSSSLWIIIILSPTRAHIR